MSARSRSRIPLIAAIVTAVLIAIAAVVWFWVLPDDDEPVADLREDAGDGAVVDATDLDGTWSVVPGPAGEGTFAGYLVTEQFAAGAHEVTATGRTPAVEGTLTVENGTVTTGSIDADLTLLTSDEGRRDQQIRERGLETNRFPDASFTLTEPVDLPTDLTDGRVTVLTVTGDLLLHGVTRSVTVDLDVRPLDDEFTLLGRIPIRFADHDIEAPDIAGFVSVADEGQIELRINLAR